MRPERLLKTPCVVWRLVEGAVDAYGNPVEAWTTSDSLCWVDLRGRTTESSETAPPTNFAIETVDIYLTPDLTITAADRVEVGSDVYKVLGPPHTFTHPRKGSEVYTHAVGRKVT